MKKQIPSAPARRARRHALSSFDQLNEAERERLGKINPLHKRYVVSRGHVVRCSFGCLMTTSKHIFFAQYLRDKGLKGIGQRVRIHGDGVKGKGHRICFQNRVYVSRCLIRQHQQCRPRSSTVHETQASARRHSFPPDKRNRSRTASNFNEIQRRAFGNKVTYTQCSYNEPADILFGFWYA